MRQNSGTAIGGLAISKVPECVGDCAAGAVSKSYRQGPKTASGTGVEGRGWNKCSSPSYSIGRIAAVAGKEDIIAEAALGDRTETYYYHAGLYSGDRKRTATLNEKRRWHRNAPGQCQTPAIDDLKRLGAALTDEQQAEVQIAGVDAQLVWGQNCGNSAGGAVGRIGIGGPASERSGVGDAADGGGCCYDGKGCAAAIGQRAQIENNRSSVVAPIAWRCTGG